MLKCLNISPRYLPYPSAAALPAKAVSGATERGAQISVGRVGRR